MDSGMHQGFRGSDRKARLDRERLTRHTVDLTSGPDCSSVYNCIVMQDN